MSGSGVPIDGTTIINNNGAVAVAPTLVDAANQGPVAAQAAATAQSAANAAAQVAGAAIPSAKINVANGVLGLDANGNPTQPTKAATFLVTQNPDTIAADLTIPSGYNAALAGPITINSDVTIDGNLNIL